jgi:hypothetical protein
MSLFKTSLFDAVDTMQQLNLSEEFESAQVKEDYGASSDEITRLKSVIRQMELKMEIFTKFIEDNGNANLSYAPGSNLTDEFDNLRTPMTIYLL